jgi:hypothetical protein
MVAALRSALSTRANRFLEILALRHQLGVLARSDRRFRPSDRLLWLCLRRLWPSWMEAVVLVQPATVGRWHREGFPRYWRRSRRRPGRPRINAQLRSLIGRMATENCLWGAPRIHGEWLKLGFTVSECIVSRSMPDRRKAPSRSWRRFLTNKFVHLAFASKVTSSDAASVHDVADARVCRLAPVSLHSTGGRSHCRAVDIRRLVSLASPPFSWRASCPRSRAPPHNPRPFAKTADVVCRRSWAERVRMGVPSLPETPFRTTSSRAAWHGAIRALNRYRRCLRNHVVNIAS